MKSRLVLISLGPAVLQGLDFATDSLDACDGIVPKSSSLPIRHMLYVMQLLRSDAQALYIIAHWLFTAPFTVYSIYQAPRTYRFLSEALPSKRFRSPTHPSNVRLLV